MVFGFGKKTTASTPQEALFPKLTVAQVRHALSTAPRAEHVSAGAECEDTAPSLLDAARQFDGVWACCCGHVNGLVVHAGLFPFKILKCAKCKHVVCKYCQKTTSNILEPCDYEEICWDLRKHIKKSENVRLIKVCSHCGLSHCAVTHQRQPYFQPKCYCSTDLARNPLCFRLGTAEDYRRDPVGAEDLAKQKWADAMVLRDYGRISDKNRRKKQAEQQIIKETRKRHGQTRLRNHVDRLAHRQNLQHEVPRPATVPTAQVSRPLRLHTVQDDNPPQYTELRPNTNRFGLYNPQELEWTPVAPLGDPIAPSFQLHLSLEHGNRSEKQDSSLTKRSAEDGHWPPLSPALRTVPLPSELPPNLRIGISVTQYPSAHGQSSRPDTARSATWNSHDTRSEIQSRPELDRRGRTERPSGNEEERLDESAHEFLKSTLGTPKYESLNPREKSEMIETVRVALLEDFQLLKLRDRE